jgi:glucose/arabinose dehydrogenase
MILIASASAALAVAAGCGGGGGSSPAPSGGSSTAPIVTPSPTASPTTAPASETRTLSVGPGLTPTATFSPLPLTGVGNSTIAVGAPSANAATTLTLTVQVTKPSGVVTPSAVRRAPLAIGGQNIAPLAYISAASTLSTTAQTSPTFSVTFTNALTSPYVYVAQYASTTGWSTIATGTYNSGTKTATFPAFTEPLTFNSTGTWFVIFTVTSALPTPTPAPNPTSVATSAPTSAPISGATAAPLPDALQFNVTGFYGETIAAGLPAPRQLVALPNGDLLVSTDDHSGTVWIVPAAEGTGPGGTPHVFLTVPNVSTEQPAQGLTFDPTANMIYVAGNKTVWQVPYTTGATSASTSSMVAIAHVRTGGIAPNSDGDVHFTTSLAVVPSTHKLYIGVGSSCNACVETDPTRGTIQVVDTGTKVQSLAAARFRNALAMTVNPATNTMWAGGAGQDDLLTLNGAIVVNDNTPLDGHPYEFFDPVTTHTGVPDYGWPMCEENNHLYNPLGVASPAPNCKSTTNSAVNDVIPSVELFAYSTIIGATFYPTTQTGTYAFPSAYRGDAFLSMHGSWHENSQGIPLAVPEVIFVPMTGDRPTTAANFANSGAQWNTLLYGFQDPTSGVRIGRPVGLAVGKSGSLFIADDFAGLIYRIRPGNGPASAVRRAK